MFDLTLGGMMLKWLEIEMLMHNNKEYPIVATTGGLLDLISW